MSSGRRGARSALIALAVVVVAALGGLVDSQSAGAWAAPSRTRPLLLVHGYNATSTSTNCRDEFGSMTTQMAGEGWSQQRQIVTIGYYSGDVGCDVNLHADSYYGDRDSWKEIAKAFSWYVYWNFTQYGIQVDAVGYSMGGLIVRGAVYGARIGAPGFAPPINVSGAVTLGTPHSGAAWYSNVCLWGQCASLTPGTADLNWLNSDCNPQGTTGTMWTVFGSNDDAVVPWASAINMCTYVDHRIVVERVSHTGSGYPNYMHSWAVVNQVMDALAVWPTRFTSGVTAAKCMDVRGGSAQPGTPVQIYDCDGASAQLWTHDDPGLPTVIQALGRCLDVKDGVFQAGQPVQIAACNGSAAQTWFINAPGGAGGVGDGTIRAQGWCLDMPFGDVTNGNQLNIWYCNGMPSQRWILA